ncbi:hypothetical protein BDQ17DRAFT_1419910 [Cyathus striatus]|nr:hypothetical protein BDQ17DRAFT_1419910 [Cyathus striatus]
MFASGNETIFIQHHEVPTEIDLCQLLETMNITIDKEKSTNTTSEPAGVNVHGDEMAEDPSYHSDAASDCSSSTANTHQEEPFGCAYLQTVRAYMENYPTTGGEYLETIFTHREIQTAYPAAHVYCSRGFSDLAYMMEKRAWRADRDADTEAVTAFRHEAWMIAATL